MLGGRTAPALPARRATRLAAALILCVAALLLGACGVSSDSHTASVGRGVLAAEPLRDIHKIRHVVIIMQENRSFDSYFGTYPGADGIPGLAGNPETDLIASALFGVL